MADLLDQAKQQIDQLTPNVEGFTRTQIVALAVASYLHGMAEAYEQPLPQDVRRELAEELRTLADSVIDAAYQR